MTDIDFDELDKAVNSIMAGGTRPSEPSRPEPVSAPSPVSPASSTGEGHSEITPISPHAEPASASRPATRVVPPRRGGRFMDVVHPSSNMRPSAASAPSQQVPRAKGVIEPIDTSMHHPAPDEKELNDLLANADLAPKPPTFDEPVASPLITDAKVDKRPLGGADLLASGIIEPEAPTQGAKVSEPTPEFLDDNANIEDPNDQLVPELNSRSDEQRRAELPAELNADLLSLETDKATPEKVTPTRAPEPKPTPTEKQPALISAGSIAIQRQYQVESSSEPAKNGSIYDTDTYHQPLMHPEHKKSGWMWIVWVLLLLALGAGGGAAAYFFLIQ